MLKREGALAIELEEDQETDSMAITLFSWSATIRNDYISIIWGTTSCIALALLNKISYYFMATTKKALGIQREEDQETDRLYQAKCKLNIIYMVINFPLH